MNNMAEKKKNHILLFRNIIWALVIFVLCAIPGKDIPNPHWVFPHIDKIVHFGMFFVMAILLCSELEYQTRLSWRKIYLTTISIAFIYGEIIELLQEYFFNRSGDILDLLADVFGAIIGCLIYPYLKRWRNNLKKIK